jgi:hypothetical protein
MVITPYVDRGIYTGRVRGLGRKTRRVRSLGSKIKSKAPQTLGPREKGVGHCGEEL